MAEELAKSMAPPTPWPTRMPISHTRPGDPCQPRDRQAGWRTTVKTAKPRLKMRTRPNMSPTRPKRHDEHGEDDHEPHQHPQQVARIARRQRVEADPPKDVRQRNQHDGLVDEHHQRAEGHGEEGDPLVAGLARRQGGGTLRRRKRRGRCSSADPVLGVGRCPRGITYRATSITLTS